jgi:hypothetical protein
MKDFCLRKEFDMRFNKAFPNAWYEHRRQRDYMIEKIKKNEAVESLNLLNLMTFKLSSYDSIQSKDLNEETLKKLEYYVGSFCDEHNFAYSVVLKEGKPVVEKIIVWIEDIYIRDLCVRLLKSDIVPDYLILDRTEDEITEYENTLIVYKVDKEFMKKKLAEASEYLNSLTEEDIKKNKRIYG